MKKFLSFMLAVCILFTAVPVQAEEEGWKKDSVGYYYVDEDGDYVYSDWIIETNGEDEDGDGIVDDSDEVYEEKRYYIDETGYMVVGWKEIDGDYYYFNGKGVMQTGWVYYKEKHYYLKSNGKMKTGWIEEDGVKYYLGEDGAMYQDGWYCADDEWYYFEKNGAMSEASREIVEDALVGIDVSYWQGDIDWDAVDDTGIDFAFIRVGHGERKLDKKFKEYIKAANKEKIPVGVYFYSTAQSVEDSILDAQFVIDSIEGYKISYPVVIDVEDKSQVDLGKDEITEIVKAFCDEIKAAGYTPMIYCNENWYRNYVDFDELDGIERWIARYAGAPADDIERDIWQATSTAKLDGIEGNVDIDFGFTNYKKKIKARTKAKSSYKKTEGFWKEDDDGTWFKRLDGTYPESEWEEIEKKWYYFDKDGYVVTKKWSQLPDGTWRYLGKSGAAEEGWSKIDGVDYYFDKDGIMQTGWEKINGSWYYLDASGAMQSGWQNLDNTWYYFDKNGKMKTGWVYDAGHWYFMDAAGMMELGWGYADNTWYYFGDDGIMKDGWQYVDNTWYYFGTDGAMATGWQYIKGSWYYMGGKDDGVMKKGWQTIDGASYYFYSDGRMAADTWVDNWYVNADGVCMYSR